MNNKYNIFAVIPCFNVKNKITNVIKKTQKYVDKIIVVDDKCPQNSGLYVKKKFKTKKVLVIFNKKNLGVGGATISGFMAAIKHKADIVVKIDGDGQMNPHYIPVLIKDIVEAKADYCKGNRFCSIKIFTVMPIIRLVGNFFLSIISKFTTGYFHIFDFTNGYIAISTQTLKRLNLPNITKNFFFEIDMLSNLYLGNFRVADVCIAPIYNNSQSNLKISNVFIYFITGSLFIFFRRIYFFYLKKYIYYKLLSLIIFIVSFYFVLAS